nr:MAG TPA: hypothetical protein [Caudoviricetes sp.]DAM16006.1 MAG TPA: hypothetical protein [Caudoviricetes sp.]
MGRFVALKPAPSAIPTPVPIVIAKALSSIMNRKIMAVIIPAIIP